MADERANHFHISHTNSQIWKLEEGLWQGQLERTLLLSLTTNSCLTPWCSLRVAISPHRKASASVQKGGAFSECSLLQLAKSRPGVSMPCSANPDLKQTQLMPTHSLLYREGSHWAESQSHAFDTASKASQLYLEGCDLFLQGKQKLADTCQTF